MKKFILFLLPLFVVAKTINVCINPDWTPIEFRNKTPKGISIDILKIIAKKHNLKLNFIKTKTWSESQFYLKKGLCDITPTAVETNKRKKYAIFTKPYLNYDLAIITKNDKSYVTNLKRIINQTFTRKKGSGLIKKLQRLYPNLKIIKANDYLEMFKLVSNNKVYFTIATLPVFAYYQKKYNLNNLKIAGFAEMTYPLRIMINKNEPELKKLLDKYLDEVSPTQKQKIYEKWTVKVKSNVDYKKLFIVILVLLFILIIALIWGYILQKKNQELQKLSQVKSQFLANMSHELRTPLNVIIGFLNIIKNNPKECEKYLDTIEGSAKSLVSLIDNILNFSRLENDKIEILNKEFSKKEFEEIAKFYEMEAKQKNLKFEYNFYNLADYFYGDMDKIRSILVELLNNSIKFTQKGKIELIIKYNNEKLYIQIIDTGIGIKNIDKIFTPFTQLDDRVNKEYNGIGLGLSIVKKLLKTLKGNLDIKTQINKGSEFYIEIPIQVSSKKANKFNVRKVLVVEDNRANQMFIKVLLDKFKIKFDMVNNGKEAVEKFKNNKYDLILMDINMPIMDGIEATKIIRQYEKENNLKPTKIIAVTANAIEGDKAKFLAIGMDDYIPKPIDINKLKEILHKS